jgi:hypothetical protein
MAVIVLALCAIVPAVAASPRWLGADLKVDNPRQVAIGAGWAKNSVNTVVFRRNSVVSHGDTQYVAFYDEEGRVVLAKRRLGTEQWELRQTQYKGNAKDAHNSISIMVDGVGFLHMSWDQHTSPLRYCRSLSPGSLELSDELPMTGKKEQSVTYPEFYRLPSGDLLFLYRDGASGRGDLMLNRYDAQTRQWVQVQDGFLSGEGRRNAYWQMTVDRRGALHLSWVWRESPDVASNHDLCYAKSTDGGRTWRRSNGRAYRLPITAATAEYALRIPEGSELINTTSMSADSKGHPLIATYWRPAGTDVPQYHLVYHDGLRWNTRQVTKRTAGFTLSGAGTKRIPISRPQVLVDARRGTRGASVVLRDQERGNRVSVAICDDLRTGRWTFEDLTTDSVGAWEPTYDTELWARSGVLHLFLQKTGQGDGETLDALAPQPVSILEWDLGRSPTIEEGRSRIR